MFSALCQGSHSLHELGKELICAENELLNSPGMAAKSRLPQCRCNAFLLPTSLGTFICGGARGYANACGGQWMGKWAESRSAVRNTSCTELESPWPA